MSEANPMHLSHLLVQQLRAALVAAVPKVAEVSIGRRDDKSTWRVHWTVPPSPEDEEAARNVIAGFEPDYREG